MNKLFLFVLFVFFLCVVSANAKYSAKTVEELNMMKRIIIEKLKKEQAAREQSALEASRRRKREGTCPLNPADPVYVTVSTCADLFAMNANGCYKLVFTAPTLNCAGFGPFAQPFTGTLHGLSRSISGLTAPLFDEVSTNGCVQDLTLISPNIVDATNDYVGGFARKVNGGRMSRLTIQGAGSLIRGTKNGVRVGGIAALAENSAEIHDCNVFSDVLVSATGTPGFVGGIVSDLITGSLINVTTSSGQIEGRSRAGGVICYFDNGQLFNALSQVTITNVLTTKRNEPMHKRAPGDGVGGAVFDALNSDAGAILSNPSSIIANGIAGFGFGQASGMTVNDAIVVNDGPGTVNGSPMPATDPSGVGSPIPAANLDASVFSGFDPELWNIAPNGVPTPEATSGEGSVLNDPHFFPLWKHNPSKLRYTVYSGIKGAVYNIITDAMVQWNVKFDHYDHLPYNFKYPEYVVAAGLTIAHPVGKKDARIQVSPSKHKGTKFFDGNLEVLINGKPIKKGVKNYLFGKDHPDFYVTKYTSRHVAISTSLFYLKYHLSFITDNFLKDAVEMKKELDGRPTARWPLFNSRIISFDGLDNAHGLLGQTARDTSPYKPAYRDCFDCFVEGKLSDYRVENDDLFGLKFKYNEYVP